MRKFLVALFSCVLFVCLGFTTVTAKAEAEKVYKDSNGNKFTAVIDENGWHKNEPATDDYKDEGGNVIISRQFGSYNANGGSHFVNGSTSTFVLAYGNNVNVNRFDLTKKNKIKFKIDPNWSNHSWFIFSVINGLENAYKASGDTWNLATEGVKINMWGGNYDENDANYASYGHLTNKISVNNVMSTNSMNYNKTGYGELEFYVGETASETYVKFGGETVTKPNVTRNDFTDGAYLQVTVSEVAEIEVSLSSESVTPQVGEHNVTFTAERGFAPQTVKVNDGNTVAIPENMVIAGYETSVYNGNTLYDINSPVTSDLNLTVKYNKVETKYYNGANVLKPLTYDTNGISDASLNEDVRYDANGNIIVPAQYGIYGPENTRTVLDEGTIFVLAGASYVTYGQALDITRPIIIDLYLNPQVAWNQTSGFVLNLFDSMEQIHVAGVDGWNPSYGYKLSVYGSSNPTDDYYNKLQINGVLSNVLNYICTSRLSNKVTIEIVIGETVEESYVNANGNKIFNLDITRNNFIDDNAYLQLLALNTNEFMLKVSQGMKSDHTVTVVDERRNITVSIGVENDSAIVFPEELQVEGFNAVLYLGQEVYDINAPVTSDLTLKVVYEKAPKTVYDVRGEIELPYDENGITANQNGMSYYDENDDELVSSAYGMYNVNMCTKVLSDGTVFVLDGVRYVTYGYALDLTKLINIRLAMNTEKSWNMDGDFVLGLFDSLDAIYKADINGWNTALGNKLPIYCSTNKGGSGVDASAYYNRIKIGEYISDELNYITYKGDETEKYVLLSIYIGNDASESCIFANGVKICNIDLKRSDFLTDQAYFQLLSLDTNQFKIKVYQNQANVDVTFKTNVAGVADETVSIFVNGVVSAPEARVIDGYTFVGYYTDASLTVEYDFSKKINKDTNIYVAYKQNVATYHTVEFKSKTGRYGSVFMQVKDGDTLYGTPTYFNEYGFAFSYQNEKGEDFDVNTPIDSDIVLTLKWYEEEIVLFHKMHGVVDREYNYERETDENGWDKNYTSWDIGDSFVDEDGNEIIDSYYGCYMPDTAFYTFPDETGFLLCYVGAMNNLLQLDVSKEITIKWKSNNWDYQNNATSGKIKFALYDGLLKALKAGYSDMSAAKVLLQVETVKTAENFGKMQDVLSGALSEVIADAAKEQPFLDESFYITIYISEDGTENYVKINGEQFSALEGVKRSDFIGGYAYLNITTNGSTQYITSLVSQKSNITVIQPTHCTIEVDKTENIAFRDTVTVSLNVEDGYMIKSLVVGGVEYDMDGAETAVIYKGWGDEEITAIVGKEYKMTFETNGGSAVKVQIACEGDTFFKPANPSKDGYTFDGWYKDAELTELYNFRTPISGDVTVYAKWAKAETPKKKGCSSVTMEVFSALTLISTAFVVLKKKNNK